MAIKGPDIDIRPGSPELPACVFVHGVGMSKYMWTDPDKARVMGGMLPIRVMLNGYDERETLFHDLMGEGFTVATWSQRRPVGPAREAVEELIEVVGHLGHVPHHGLIIIGHSRGGLIARAALVEKGFPHEREKLRGLITICSPHGGTELSHWAGYVGKMTKPINSMIEAPDGQNSVRATIKRILEFLESKGVMELLPGSDFLRSLGPAPPEGAYCLSLGGTNPALITMPGFFAFPSSFEKVFPSDLYPEEISAGKGDGLVSAASARLPFGAEHMDFHVNHAAVAVDTEVRQAVMKRIKEHCLG